MFNLELLKKDLIDISGGNMSPEISKLLSETKGGVDTIKNRKEKLFEEVKELEKFGDFDGYVEHRQILLEKLNAFFLPEINGESEDFKEYFKKSSSGKLSPEIYSNSTIKKFNRLLVRKNLFLKELTLKTLENGIYNEFLDEDEVNDLQIIIKSKIFDNYDKIYFKFKDSIKKYRDNYFDKKGDLTYNGKLNYGGLGENGFKSYSSFMKKIEKYDFSKIKQDYLRKYFVKFQEIFLSGTTSYDKWLELAELEMDTWKNSDSNIAIIGSMESYDFEEVLIELESEIFIKRPALEYSKKSSLLSEKYFEKGYRMKNTKYSSVEPMISGGVVSYKQILGKNFHNDKNIQNKYGVYGYSIESRMRESEKKIKDAEKLFGRKLIISNEEFSNSSIAHTWQHEFGHNLFKKENGEKFTSFLEENKANLFSLLYTYNDINDKNISKEKIQKNIEYLFGDEIRRFKNIDPDKKDPYTLSAQLQIQKMFDNKVIYWGDNGFIEINKDQDNLKAFYNEMKDFLITTKEIYETEDKQREKELIERIEIESEVNVAKIVKLSRM